MNSLLIIICRWWQWCNVSKQIFFNNARQVFSKSIILPISLVHWLLKILLFLFSQQKPINALETTLMLCSATLFKNVDKLSPSKQPVHFFHLVPLFICFLSRVFRNQKQKCFKFWDVETVTTKVTWKKSWHHIQVI